MQADAHHTFGVVLEGVHLTGDAVAAVFLRGGEQAAFADAMGGDLGGEVAPAFVRRADVGEDQVEGFVLDLAAPKKLDRRDPEAFLVDLAGKGHRAGRHAADVGVVGAGGEVVGGFGIVGGEDSGDGRDVRQVRAAAEGVVENDDVAGVDRMGT